MLSVSHDWFGILLVRGMNIEFVHTGLRLGLPSELLVTVATLFGNTVAGLTDRLAVGDDGPAQALMLTICKRDQRMM